MKDTVVEKASSAAFADTKPHYELLDGMRGVAALLVIWYHVFEGFATSPYDQRFNHGYLAVDFFFILSGFVIGYAYDDRWPSGKMTLKSFFKRRLIRPSSHGGDGSGAGRCCFLYAGMREVGPYGCISSMGRCGSGDGLSAFACFAGYGSGG